MLRMKYDNLSPWVPWRFIRKCSPDLYVPARPMPTPIQQNGSNKHTVSGIEGTKSVFILVPTICSISGAIYDLFANFNLFFLSRKGVKQCLNFNFFIFKLELTWKLCLFWRRSLNHSSNKFIARENWLNSCFDSYSSAWAPINSI